MIEAKSTLPRSAIVLVGATLFTLVIAVVLYFHVGGTKTVREEPLEVIKAYLKASYARDSAAAYRYISSRDQLVWDESSYASQYGKLTGFALDLARKLADSMEIWVMEQRAEAEQVSYKIGYSVPAADELASLLFDWDPDKLNVLSRSQQQELLKTLEKTLNDGKMITIKGQESFSLIADQQRWKIFHDWASGTKVRFNITLPPSSGIDVQLVNSQFLVKREEAFQIVLKIKNRNQQPVLARIIHDVEPADMADSIDMIACGALQPLTLEPGNVQEISSAYMIKDETRAGTKIAITYEFQLESLVSEKRDHSKTNAVKRVRKNAA
jgi:cytochrome c oxidase assembly protein Cox11